MNKIVILSFAVLSLNMVSCVQQARAADKAATPAKSTETTQTEDWRNKPAGYWKSKLNPTTYNVTRCSATEPAFTGKYWNNHESGIYKCSNCGAVLFDSKDKFDSGTGWPSFTQAEGNSVEKKADRSFGMVRDEVICKHCGAHLGHLFADGPAPTGMRYCINSASLDFKEAAKGGK